MLHSSNLVLLVGDSDSGDFSPRKVTVWNTSLNSVICSFWPFASRISIVKINKKRMIICERTYLHIYTTGDMKILHTIDIGNVSLGRLILSHSSEKNNFLCYSSNEEEGIIKVYDLLSLAFKNSIKAHKSPVMKMTISANGELLATCSGKGTIIRVFSLPKGDKIFTFKRGLSSANIYSINFSKNCENLVISSDTGTMHIFDTKQINENGNENSNSNSTSTIASYFTSILHKVIPKDYEDYIGVTRSSLSFNNAILKVNNIICFNPNNIQEVFCFTSEGSFYLFSINYENKTISKINECNIKNLRLII
jgi:autophagy-related protein 18